MRLNKYLSEAGVCSRREADRLILSGCVTISGKKAVLGDMVSPDDKIFVNGREVPGIEEPVLLLYNKPVGVVCTAEKREKDNIIDKINYKTRIFPVGRLDKASRGLILLTNQGDLSNKILKARYRHEKEYEVILNKPFDDMFLRKMAKGVYLKDLDKTTRPCFIERLPEDDKGFRIILTQGLNRQIRRMCESLSYKVKDLKRVRIMNLTIDGIEEGKYRKIREDEFKELKELLEN